jgi:hypothetical protein
MEETNNLANTMAAEFDMKARYFLDIFFQGGAHMINHQDAVNPYNAFKSFKAAELREGASLWCPSSPFLIVSCIILAGESKKGAELHADHFEEYEALTPEEKTNLANEFGKICTQNFHLRRDTPRAKVQDVANVVRNMKMLVRALKYILSSRNTDGLLSSGVRPRSTCWH